MALDFMPELMPREGGKDDPWPADKAYEVRAKYWLNAAYEEAEAQQAESEELRDVEKYISYLGGKQWGKDRPSYKSKPVNNKTFRLFWELVGLLTDIKPIIHIQATMEDNESAKRQQDVLNKSVKAWWLNTDADLSLAQCVAYGLLTTGFAKQEWNKNLNNGEGDIQMVPTGPHNVLMLKPEDSLQSSQAVIYKAIKPVGWVKDKYPKRGGLVIADPKYSTFSLNPEAPANIPAMAFELLSPAMRHILKGNSATSPSAYPMCLYREFWIKDYSINTSNQEIKMGDQDCNWSYVVKPNGRLYPRGRLFVMAGREIVHDGPNPYWHGRFPFSMLRMNIVPWSIYGLSDMKSWVELQDIINNILAGVIDVIKKVVNPGFYAPKNALSESAWNSIDWAMPGARLQYSAASPHEPKFAPAPSLPPFVLQVYNQIEREMEQQSLGGSMSEALKKKQVPGGDTLDAIKSEKTTPVRLKGRNIEVFLRDQGSMLVPNIMQFYNLKRRMSLLGPRGLTSEDFDWDPNTMVPAGVDPAEHIRKFRFMIQPDSLLNIKRQEEKMQVLRLRLMGDIDRRTMYELLDANVDIDKIEKRLAEERAKNIGPAPMGKGGARAVTQGGKH